MGSFLWIISLLIAITGSGSALKPFYGTFNVSWYPEITSREDMGKYLRANYSLMTTAKVSLWKSNDNTYDVLDVIVGTPGKGKPFTLIECLLDLFTRTTHQIQFIFSDVYSLARVVDLLMLMDSNRIWLHLELVPLPRTTRKTDRLLDRLNRALCWSNMVLSVGVKPEEGSITDYYSSVLAIQMKRIANVQNVPKINTVFVLDGYTVQKQVNFVRLMKNMILMKKVYFLLRVTPDKEDKIVIADLNATMMALGGKYRVFLDISRRLREIVLHNIEPATLEHPHDWDDGSMFLDRPNNTGNQVYRNGFDFVVCLTVFISASYLIWDL